MAYSPLDIFNSVRASRWPFLALCLYLLSQAFTIPILAIGPSWAVWPTIGDFASGFLLIAALLSICRKPTASASGSRAQQLLLPMLLIMLGGCALSFAAHALSMPEVQGIAGKNSTRAIGAYNLYRLLQFTLLYWAVTTIPFPQNRIEILRKLVTVALILACAGLVLDYLGVVGPSVYGSHLPKERSIGGAWAIYTAAHGAGGGTIGYDHAYTSVQVLLLLALRIHLLGGRRTISDTWLVLLALTAVFTTGCRAVSVATPLFVLGVYSKRLPDLIKLVVACSIGIALLGSAYKPAIDLFTRAIERQSTVTESLHTDGFAGRTTIWRERLQFLEATPSRWVWGVGLGSATESGGNAHMLYLQILLEHGLIGLLFFSYVFCHILANLYHRDPRPKAVFWATVAILACSFAQDTLYPNAWTGHFLGFYLCSVAIVLRSPLTTRPAILSQRRSRRKWELKGELVGLGDV